MTYRIPTAIPTALDLGQGGIPFAGNSARRKPGLPSAGINRQDRAHPILAMQAHLPGIEYGYMDTGTSSRRTSSHPSANHELSQPGDNQSPEYKLASGAASPRDMGQR